MPSQLRVFVLFGSALLVTACGTGGGGSLGSGPVSTNTAKPTPKPTATATAMPTPSPQPSTDHVVIIVQEGRSPDNLFQGLPGADIATSGLASTGQTVALQSIPLDNSYDIDTSHAAFLAAYDGGKMDGANTEVVTCGAHCPYADPQYGYVPASDDVGYMQLATQYTFGDRMFATNQGPSYPAHQFLLSGTSEPSVGSDLLASENPTNPGCGPTGGALVPVIDPAGDENQELVACFEHQTLPDLLDAKGVSWRYYVPSNVDEGSPATSVAPNSISHLRLGADWAKVTAPETTILENIADRTLPQVSWVIPSVAESDEASATDGSGPSWVSSVVNAIGNSPYWQNTTILIIWDDWGGWYDHVKPPIYNSYELGFRVPLIVVSPYAKRGYVSHVQHEFGSVLKYVEENYGTGSLGFTDSRADDLSDCFDFTQAPAIFKTIAARRSHLERR